MDGDDISRALGENWLKITLGWNAAAMAMGIISCLTFVKVYQQTFENAGIPFIIVGICIPAFVAVSAWITGDILIKKNIQAAYTSLVNREANPELKKIMDDVAEIRKSIQEITRDNK